MVAAAAVQTGADRLVEPRFHQLLEHRRVAVLAHYASHLSSGEHVVDYLRREFDLRLIFAPEHGLRSSKDESVPDSIDPATGLPVISLYGPRRAPSAAQLARVDVVVVDLQDVGVRFYTYPATVGWLLEACARAGKQVILLDRPNPMGLERAEGPVLEPRWAGGITSFYPTTTLEGMTLGELARLYNDALGIHADLTVVPVAGLRRDTSWEETGLPWLAPSPALPTLEQARLYGIFGVLETLNLAVGRGRTNERAFHLFGAPWISPESAHELARSLGDLRLPGLRFSYAEWVPTRREFAGRRCRGFQVELAGEPARPFQSLVAVLARLRESLGASSLHLAGMDRALGATWVREALERGEATEAILARARKESEAFLARRAPALLY